MTDQCFGCGAALGVYTAESVVVTDQCFGKESKKRKVVGWMGWGKGVEGGGHGEGGRDVEKGEGCMNRVMVEGGGRGTNKRRTIFLTKACAISIVDRFAASVVHLSSQNTKEKHLCWFCDQLPPCRIQQCWLVLLV